MTSLFSVIGQYIKGSGFKEIIFQADLCSSGSIIGVSNGKHYNRCWIIHDALAEALERLFIEIYCNIRLGSGLESSTDQLINTLQKARNGEMGVTTKYWVTYLNL